tara:strand:- start:75 stop:956 length:882 start_codon:yes stop_codon:yes gene_type:complete
MCAKGDVDLDWKIKDKDIMDFRKFKTNLSRQMMAYSPVENKYIGDDSVREYSRTNKRVRNRRNHQTTKNKKQRHIPSDIVGAVMTVSSIAIRKAIDSGRLQSNLTNLDMHIKSKIFKKGKPRQCYVCGTKTTSYCGICTIPVEQNDGSIIHEPTPLCFFRGKKQCYVDYHNFDHFGMCRGDSNETGSKKEDWQEPTCDEVKRQAAYIKHCTRCIKCTDQVIVDQASSTASISNETNTDIQNTAMTTTCHTNASTSDEAGTSPNTVDTATESDVNTHHTNKNDDTNIGNISEWL